MGRVGVGDMKKSVYDPDKDGVIALAQLAAAVCSETEAGTIADGKITTHSGAVDPHADRAYTDTEVAAKDIGEGHITILPFNYDSIGQGTWVLTVAASHPLNFQFNNTSNTDLDNISYKVYLAAGTYTLRVIHYKSDSQGIVDIDIDGVEKASVDCYAAVVDYDAILSQTGIVIATSGLKTIKFRLDGKNGASSSYGFRFSEFALWRPA